MGEAQHASLYLHFENGKEEIDLRHNFSKNSATRIIDLPGNRRFIDRIVLCMIQKQPNKEIKSFGLDGSNPTP